MMVCTDSCSKRWVLPESQCPYTRKDLTPSSPEFTAGKPALQRGFSMRTKKRLAPTSSVEPGCEAAIHGFSCHAQQVSSVCVLSSLRRGWCHGPRRGTGSSLGSYLSTAVQQALHDKGDPLCRQQTTVPLMLLYFIQRQGKPHRAAMCSCQAVACLPRKTDNMPVAV